jgi:RNA polymerase sigma-70 factor (ECF subfamily)
MEPLLSEWDDKDLVARAKAGDAEAFGELYRRYAGEIYRYLLVRMGDAPDAEDLTEEVFFRSFQSLGGYRERGWPFSAFLYRVAKNMLIDFYRKRKTDVPLSQAETKLDALRPLDDHLVRSEEQKILRQAIDELPPHYREVIILRVILDLPTAVVAKWMDQTEGSIRVQLHRALEMLRGRMRMQNEE